MIDIFGNTVHVGDTVAVGMSFGRSSVLRVGEVVSIKEKNLGFHQYHNEDHLKWTVRIRWTHNGSGNRKAYGEVKESNILHESTHTYAKLIVLPPGYAQRYPSDVGD